MSRELQKTKRIDFVMVDLTATLVSLDIVIFFVKTIGSDTGSCQCADY